MWGWSLKGDPHTIGEVRLEDGVVLVLGDGTRITIDAPFTVTEANAALVNVVPETGENVEEAFAFRHRPAEKIRALAGGELRFFVHVPDRGLLMVDVDPHYPRPRRNWALLATDGATLTGISHESHFQPGPSPI
jgi:hypothetical protein